MVKGSHARCSLLRTPKGGISALLGFHGGRLFAYSSSYATGLPVDPQQPGVLYAQASDHLLASEDDGANWRLSLAAPGVMVFGAGDLLVDPHDPRRLLAGTAKRGIFTFTEP